MGEHIKPLHANHLVTGKLSDIFDHSLRVTAGIKNVFWRERFQLRGQLTAQTTTRRIDQH
ncbi:Uncharacterised protein [Vibrio cholerae]|uniref:Uncharacterized protein n=1 Tax=Vibrio cholerae TaxID=666 RepID=A0A655YYU3_VIBCL|nr:Uncharacterised protein [Vibrio cholerae]